MCTVIFIPKGDQFYFASLRDEHPLRNTTTVPEIYRENDSLILSPKDARLGGTWLGLNNHANVIILLNGAFEKHIPKNKYRKSRGLIVKELLASKTPVKDWITMYMQDIEPYTLVVFENNSLYQLVWDGERKHHVHLSSHESYLWSSSTLYNKESSTYRNHLFQQWKALNPNISAEDLLRFFESYKEEQNGFIMNRQEQIKTLSFTFIHLQMPDAARMLHHDLINNQVHEKTMNFIDTESYHIEF